MFDPFAKIVYDYMGGMEDIKKANVCMYLFDAVV
jgi:tRNA nucleotidyltransferase/poly(A) polymerase